MQPLILLLLASHVISASFTDVLDNTTTSLYYMVSRSVVLYLLLVWFTFMYISCISEQKERNYDSLLNQSELDGHNSAPQAPPQPLPSSQPSAPVYSELLFGAEDNQRDIENMLMDFRMK